MASRAVRKSGRDLRDARARAEAEVGGGGKGLLTQCSSCGADSTPEHLLQRCSACRCVAYCGAKCQKTDWTCGHKRECAKLSLLRMQGNQTSEERAKSAELAGCDTKNFLLMYPQVQISLPFALTGYTRPVYVLAPAWTRDDCRKTAPHEEARKRKTRKSIVKTIKLHFKRERTGCANFTGEDIGDLALDALLAVYLEVPGCTVRIMVTDPLATFRASARAEVASGDPKPMYTQFITPVPEGYAVDKDELRDAGCDEETIAAMEAAVERMRQRCRSRGDGICSRIADTFCSSGGGGGGSGGSSSGASVAAAYEASARAGAVPEEWIDWVLHQKLPEAWKDVQIAKGSEDIQMMQMLSGQTEQVLPGETLASWRARPHTPVLRRKKL